MNYIKRNIRPNILDLVAYSCARNEFKIKSNTEKKSTIINSKIESDSLCDKTNFKDFSNKIDSDNPCVKINLDNSIIKIDSDLTQRDSMILLDANENPFETSYNRYPDPNRTDLRDIISKLKQVNKDQILFGNGSDEIIDIIIRSSCIPSRDNIVYFYPGYGMYEVCANINDVENRKVLLDNELKCDFNQLFKNVDANSKIIFLCNPHNPTGFIISGEDIEKVCKNFDGWVVIDEAYIDFSPKSSGLKLLSNNKNLIVMQTMSKAYGMAGLRLGMCFACSELISIFNNIRAPYNINSMTQSLVVKNLKETKSYVNIILSERNRLNKEFKAKTFILTVYESSANFILIKCIDAKSLYNYLVSKNCIVRLRDINPLMSNCIRITVGSPEQNTRLLNVLSEFENQKNKPLK